MKRGIVASLAVLAGVSFGETCTWTGAWDVEPQEGDAIVIASGDLTWKSPLPMSVASWTQNADYTGTVTFDTGLETFTVTGDVTLNGGTWTHTANPSFKSTDEGWMSGRGTKQLIVSCGGNFTIEENAAIDVHNMGFRNAQGPAVRCHGGNGSAQTGKCYGSLFSPITIGSGGRDQAGGGAVHLTVAGALTVDGPINADCVTNGGGDHHGAGGSVFLVAGSMSGAGNITAIYGYSPSTTSGGGGRISLKLTGDGDFSGLTGSITTAKGIKSESGAGTIYYETKAQAGGKGKLVLDNAGTSSEVVGRGADIFNDGETYDFDEIVIRNGGRLTIHSGAVVSAKKITGHSYTYSYLELNGGTLKLPADYVLTNVRIRNRATDSRLLVGDDGDLILGSGAYLYTTTAATELTVPGDLTVKSGAVATSDATASTSDSGYGIRLQVLGDMTVESGGLLNAVGLGFNKDMESIGRGTSGSSCGGSHGGVVAGAPVTRAYGSVKYPDTLGSGVLSRTERAGGRIRVKVGGTLTVNGMIDASGSVCNGCSLSTSGGSIWVTAGALAGSGFICAGGGYLQTSTYPGAGGRVAVYLTGATSTFDGFYQAGGDITACGARSQNVEKGRASKEFNKPVGAGGTVYLSDVSSGKPFGRLIVENRDSATRTCGATIGPNVTDTDVDAVVFRTNGVLRIGQDGCLKVHQDFARDPLRKDKFITEAGDADHAAGTVEFIDAAQISEVTGTNDFAKLVVNAPGKTVKFGTANEATCTEVGVFEITGDESAKVSIRSMTDGTSWPLRVYGSAAVNFADVRDSDASTGLKISAKDSTDGGNNENWKFSTIVVGETITWTGASDSNWSNVDNWDRQREPVDTDVVVIPEGKANMPALSAAVTLNTLEVQSGAQLALAGYYLDVTNRLTVAGSLVCSAQEVITLSGPTVDFAGGSFICANSTLVTAGDLDLAFNPNAQDFHIVRFTRTGGTTAVSDAFKAYQLYLDSATPVTYRFAKAKTVETADFYLSGVGAGNAPAITLSSAEDSAAWLLKVTRTSRVQGALVRDSHATASASEVCANDPSTNLGGNDKWRFDVNIREWIGGNAGASFNDGANWKDGNLPDASSLVYFSEDAKLSVVEPITIRELVVAAGTVDFVRGTNEITVAESLTVEDGAVLSMTSPLKVNGNAMLRKGATMTHDQINEAQGSFTNHIELTVGLDLYVESGARIDASLKGFHHSSIGAGGLGHANGPSHGGVGASGKPSYDSVFAPIHPGSPSISGDAGNIAGGAVKIVVAGTIHLDGTVSVNGKSDSNWSVGTGGSVWITAGDLTGGGSISANAGQEDAQSSNGASGGRIAVVLTAGEGAGWTGSMSATERLGVEKSHSRLGAPGTIYFEKASEGPKGGTLYLNGQVNAHYPVAYNRDGTCCVTLDNPGWDSVEDFRRVKIAVSNAVNVRLTKDMRAEDIVCSAANEYSLPLIDVQSHVLTLESREHRRGRGWDLPSGMSYTNIVDTTQGGAIVWPKAFMIFIR